jgi:hypothetical protein
MKCRGDCAPSILFDLLWVALCDVLGNPATATLVRRSSKLAVLRQPQLAGLTIKREEFQYRYLLPNGWTCSAVDSLAALRALVDELQPLLIEMTGQVVVRRLSAIPELRECGLLSADEAHSPEVR